MSSSKTSFMLHAFPHTRVERCTYAHSECRANGCREFDDGRREASCCCKVKSLLHTRRRRLLKCCLLCWIAGVVGVYMKHSYGERNHAGFRVGKWAEVSVGDWGWNCCRIVALNYFFLVSSMLGFLEFL